MSNDSILTTTCLSDFFYKDLSTRNKTKSCPIPEEFVFYSSLTLEKYAFTEKYFDTGENGVSEKILGLRYLESQNKPGDERLAELKDIGDTVLVLLGFFSDSINKKLISRDYYFAIAKNAYSDLNKMDMQFYDIPNFYDLFASSLNNTIVLLEDMAQDFRNPGNDQYLINLDVNNKKVV